MPCCVYIVCTLEHVQKQLLCALGGCSSPFPCVLHFLFCSLESQTFDSLWVETKANPSPLVLGHFTTPPCTNASILWVSKINMFKYIANEMKTSRTVDCPLHTIL